MDILSYFRNPEVTGIFQPLYRYGILEQLYFPLTKAVVVNDSKNFFRPGENQGKWMCRESSRCHQKANYTDQIFDCLSILFTNIK